MNNRELGIIGENAAAELLEKKGYNILMRNYRCRLGELDIIAGRGGRISFVEVKTRQGDSMGRPCEAVTAEKMRHIRGAASHYLRGLADDGYSYQGIDFQVIEVTINQMEDAF